MPIEFIQFDGVLYPKHEAEGNAARWIMPLAQHYCKGKGLDVGYSKEAWMLPGAIGIEPTKDPTYHAMHLPKGEFDYIFSSHMLEHIQGNWCDTLDYWFSKIKSGGILFLYLPHISQKYWNVHNNRKHVHQFTGDEIWEYISNQPYFAHGFKSGPDYNHSFVVVIEKR